MAKVVNIRRVVCYGDKPDALAQKVVSEILARIGGVAVVKIGEVVAMQLPAGPGMSRTGGRSNAGK